MGADSFNVYLVVSNINNYSRGRVPALRKEYEGKCEYLMKFENQDANFSAQSQEINGHITSDTDDETNKRNNENNETDTDVFDTETEVEDKDTPEQENLKYVYIFFTTILYYIRVFNIYF